MSDAQVGAAQASNLSAPKDKISSFLKWEVESRDVIDVKRCYIRIAEDLVSGVLLSQIVYWFLPSKKTGTSRITIDKDGKKWLAKKREDWWDECCISPKQFDRSIEILQSLGVIETAIFKFNGSPTKHISLNYETLFNLIGWVENESSPKVNNEVYLSETFKLTNEEEPITETTAKTPSEKKDPAANAAATDPRYEKFLKCLDAYWKQLPNHEHKPLPMDGAGGKNLKLWLKAHPQVEEPEWWMRLENMFASENINPAWDVRKIVARINDYADGPLNKYGQLLNGAQK